MSNLGAAVADIPGRGQMRLLVESNNTSNTRDGAVAKQSARHVNAPLLQVIDLQMKQWRRL